MVIALIAFLLVLLLVVGIHEAGHAIVARFFKVKIEHIAIGFGRPLLKWQSKSGVKWIWALWPLGGAVRLLNTRIADVPKYLHSQFFDKQPGWVRTLILLAGVVANLLLAWCALLLVFMMGINHRPPVVKQVIPNTIAYQAGLQGGDTIESVNGIKIVSWEQFGQALIMDMGNSSLAVALKTAAGKKKDTQINLEHWQISSKDHSLLSSFGVFPDKKVKKKRIIADSFSDALKLASQKLLSLLLFFIVMIERVVTRAIPFALLLGPIGILEVTSYSFIQGLSVFSMFLAELSLAVAVVNSLPIPGLDGGSIIYTWIEKIRGKPMSVGLEVLLYRLAVIAFVVLFVNLILNDLQRFLRLPS